MMLKGNAKTAAVYVAFALLFALVFTLTTFAFGGYSQPTAGEWYNTSWHYRIRVEINTTAVNTTDWPVEMQMNFTDLLPEGTFDNSSIRVFEYNTSGKIVQEVPSQFDKGADYTNTTNAVGEFVFLMNGTTQPNSKRIFYIYYDAAENGLKQPPVYPTNLTYSWNGQILQVNTSRLEIDIDTNRGENTSGIYYVREKRFGVPVISNSNEGERTAEYLEFFNGTTNTSFNLIGNATFVTGPVRFTMIQEGQEVVFGTTNQTNAGSIVKKYYLYSHAGPQARGSFLKIANEFFANVSVNRSSSGFPALDFQRTSLGQEMDPPTGSASDPYSWISVKNSFGSVAGIVNLNETVSDYFASSSPGRIEINLSTKEILAGTSIRQISMLYFGTGGGDGVSEFFEVRNSTSNPPVINTNLTEKLITSVKPEINRTIFNLNETIMVKGNVSLGDPYNVITFINATLDMGTGAADDITMQLYDDGTNGDDAAGDKIFTNNYTLNVNSTLGEWRINFTAYGNATQFLNSTIFSFNVTNVYSVNVTIFNYVGIVGRQVVANVSVSTFDRYVGIAEAFLNCSFAGNNVTNKTDNGNGIYSINFTAPSQIGTFNLFCSAVKNNNTGNDTKFFTTEPPKTNLSVNVTPKSSALSGISLYSNETTSFTVNITDIGNGTAKSSNISLVLLNLWSANTTLQNCGDITVNNSCFGHFNVTVPNGTVPGNYSVNITVGWTNPDDTENTTRAEFNVTVLPNPRINVTEINVTGIGADGTVKNIGSFTVNSVGNYEVDIVTFNCTSGTVCQYFNISFSPQNISSFAVGENSVVSINAAVPLNYTPGQYNGTVNVTGAGMDISLDVFVSTQNTTDVFVSTYPETVVISGISVFTGANFQVLTNVTNLGNASARNTTVNFTLPVNWTINASFELCGAVTYNSSCYKNNTISVPNSTLSGNYTINITTKWINVDNSNNTFFYTLNVTVAESPVITFDNFTLTGAIPDGKTANPFNLTVLSVGASTASNIRFNCTTGVVCSNFTPTFTPSLIANLAPGTNVSVRINFTIPTMFHAGIYTGVLNVTSSNAENRSVLFEIEVISNGTWTLTPTFCKRSMYQDEGKVCDINISNLGNAMMNFTIVNVLDNHTYTNVTNFSVDQYQNYTFSVMYNVTGVAQEIFNSTFAVVSLGVATPQNITFNVSLLPATPPLINVTFVEPIDQTSDIVITANVTDMTNSGIYSVNISVVRPNGTIDYSNMSLLSTTGNVTLWSVGYGQTFGNTTLRGTYNISVYASDNLGNVGNASENFGVRKKVSIASNTLSDQYVQGDTGTIYYSARDIGNVGVPDVNVTFWLYDPNATLLYTTFRTTDSLGTFSPLPVFEFASDATVGNYTLISNSSFLDEVLNITFVTQKNYTANLKAKTVVVNGLFVDIETAVVWFPNNIMRFNMLIYDGEGRVVDPTDLLLRVYDPAQNIYFTTNLSAMTKRGVGFYSYSHSMSPASATGMYLAHVNVTRSSLTSSKLKAFRVAQGGPYDVRLTAARSEVEQGTPLDFTITIENKGEVTQDVFVNYTVVNVATGTTYYFASEAVLTPAFTNQSFSRSAFIFSDQPLGNYILKAVVKYDNTQPDINVSTTFAVIARRVAPPNGTGGGGGGGGTGPVITGDVITPEGAYTVNSITIEKYNKDIRVYPGFKRIEYVIVRNSGKSVLHGISMNIVGLQSSWFNITPSIYSEMVSENSTVFLIEYNIPNNAQMGDYKFNLVVTTTATSDQKSVTLHVVGSLQDLIMADIAQLRTDLKNLLIDIGSARSQGKRVDEVLLMADEAEDYINRAEINYNLNNTKDALDNIKDARMQIDKARDLLNRLEIVVGVGIDLFMIIMLIIIPVCAMLILLILNKKKKVPKQFSQHIPNFLAIIEKLRTGKADTTSLSREREKVSRMLVVLDRERKENMISEDAYREMKKTAEEKLQRISKKLKS